jgi:uncharacterized repeat protein (TIGR03803 family)
MMNVTLRAEGIVGISSWSIKTGPAMAALLTLVLILAPAAPAQTFSLLHQFKSGPGGINPAAGVVFDPKGNLYGTTLYDGAFTVGTVFRMSPAGNEKVLYSFTGIGGDGAFPEYGTLARDSSGNLYGTTGGGGLYDQFCPYSCGTVFEVDASGKETVLYSFTGTGGDGNVPWGGVVRDPAGNLYGTTTSGGTYNWGAVFKVDPTGKETVLYSFTGGADGGNPWAGLIRDAKATFMVLLFSTLCLRSTGLAH